MRWLRFLNPFWIRDTARQIRSTTGGGGPAAIRIAGVDGPQGLFIPTARVHLEVKARDGSVTRFEPDVPVPFPYAWAYRVARKLGVPLVSSLNPQKLKAELRIPGR